MRVASELKVISGYTSPHMIQRFILDYPATKLIVYIGMALEGISYRNHLKYIEIMNDYKNIKIYYKIKYPLTHIKLYSFYNEGKNISNLVGSANFSEAGLLNNEEILYESLEDFQKIYHKIHDFSKLCSDQEIVKYINLFDRNERLINLETKEEKGKEIYKYLSENKHLTRSISSALEADFRIPLLFPTNNLANSKGINAWIREQEPYLEQSNNFAFSRYFPTDREFDIITNENEQFKGKLNLINDNQMEISPNIYEYLRKKMRIKDRRPITYQDLSDYNMTEIWGNKIKDDIYFFDFSPRNQNRRR